MFPTFQSAFSLKNKDKEGKLLRIRQAIQPDVASTSDTDLHCWSTLCFVDEIYTFFDYFDNILTCINIKIDLYNLFFFIASYRTSHFYDDFYDYR